MSGLGHLRQPALLYYGISSLHVLPKLLEHFGSARPFTVLDGALAASSSSEKIRAFLPRNAVVFSDTRSDPDVDLVDSTTDLARSHSADLIIGIGGGSAMDLAKAVSVMFTNAGSAAEYQGFNLVRKRGLPKIMVPSTTGTGAEATWSAVLVNRKLGKKGGINSPYVLPDVAILDPMVTMTAPRAVALSSCADALTHAIESYTATNSTPVSRFFSELALRTLLGSIEAACNPDRRSEEIMLNMLQGSYWAAIAIGGSETGPCHALGYPLSVRYSVPHGLANAILLPHVMQFNVSVCTDVYGSIADMLDPGLSKLSQTEKAARSPRIIAELMRRLGLTSGLRSFGINESDIPALAVEGLKLRGPLDNAPRSLDVQDAENIYKDCLDV
jgi:alcohol dehydrogenase